MDGPSLPPAAGPWSARLWGLCLLALVGAQAWMTLSLFGPGPPWERLLNDEPIVSGRHPLHLYHGSLGAAAFHDRGTICCYDPAFQAGYPKTPVFDSGSRLAELFLAVAGGSYRPAAYKVGLAVCFLGIPLLLVAAARGVGLSWGATCLATGAGLLVCWGAPGRAALEAGDLDVLAAALAALLQFSLLVRFDRAPGLATWAGILASGCLGWLANPLLFATLFPLVLLYYLSVGARHAWLSWHLSLLVGLLGGLGVNAFWLVDWVRHWWIRSPLPASESLLPHRTFQSIWQAPLWGAPVDRALAVGLVGLAVFGVLVFNQCKQRPAARLLGLGAGGLLSLAVLGIASDRVGRLHTCQLLVPALWFATLPAAHALAQGLSLFSHRLRRPWCAAGLLAALVLAAVLTGPHAIATLGDRLRQPTPLAVGLGPQRERLVQTLVGCTTPEARILWEDLPQPPTGPHWTPLLPLLTGRAFVGGLDPEAGIEHAYVNFVDQILAGRHVLQWSDGDLDDFCRRYNVGWVVCRSRPAVERLGKWPAARRLAALGDGGPGALFAVRRPHSFALKGRAQLVRADSRHLTFADVVPEDGGVVLSFHYQKGLRAFPSRVQVEREPDPNDPIPFIRLRVSGPVARLTLTWDEH